MKLTLSEKLFQIYKRYRPEEFAATNGAAALSWTLKILEQLESNDRNRTGRNND